MSEVIKIWQPRYRDRTCLVAKYYLTEGKSACIYIVQGSYKGMYNVSPEVIEASPLEDFTTRSGKVMKVRAIPLDKMDRVGVVEV